MPFSWLSPFSDDFRRKKHNDKNVNLNYEDNDNYWLIQSARRHRPRYHQNQKYRFNKFDKYDKHHFDYGFLVFGLLPLFLLLGALLGHEYKRVTSGSGTNVAVNVNTSTNVSSGN